MYAIYVRWSTCHPHDLRFGHQPWAKACWWLQRISWQGTTSGDVLGEYWTVDKSVHPCHQDLHRFCRWWWRRSSNWLCSVWLWSSSKKTSPDQRKCGNFKLWYFYALCVVRKEGISMAVWLCKPTEFWTMGRRVSQVLFCWRKALCTTFDSETPTALSTTVAQSH